MNGYSSQQQSVKQQKGSPRSEPSQTNTSTLPAHRFFLRLMLPARNIERRAAQQRHGRRRRLEIYTPHFVRFLRGRNVHLRQLEALPHSAIEDRQGALGDDVTVHVHPSSI